VKIVDSLMYIVLYFLLWCRAQVCTMWIQMAPEWHTTSSVWGQVPHMPTVCWTVSTIMTCRWRRPES